MIYKLELIRLEGAAPSIIWESPFFTVRFFSSLQKVFQLTYYFLLAFIFGEIFNCHLRL